MSLRHHRLSPTRLWLLLRSARSIWPLWFAAAGCSPEPSPPGPSTESDQPNILLISLDTTRADILRCGGGDGTWAPRLEELAATSVCCTNARSTTPITLPSHTSIMTGLYPTGHGVHDNDFYRIPSDAQTLAVLLGEAGYRTEAFIAATVLRAATGLNHGFEHYDEAATRYGRNRVLSSERRADEMTDTALARLAVDDPRPWFFWVHYFDPHAPYDAPGSTAAPADKRGAYRAEVAFTDRHVGRLLDAAAALGDRAPWIVLVADHGEGLATQQETTHGMLAEESTLRIPLLIRAPDGSLVGELDSPTSCVDVFATLLELIDVAPPYPIDGIDLIDLWRRTSTDSSAAEEAAERAIYFETHHAHNGFGWAPLEGIVVDEYKYVRGLKDELFRIDPGPGEPDDLAAEQADVVTALQRRFDQLLGASPPRWDAENSTLSPAEQAELAALGYLARSSSSGTSREDWLDPRKHYQSWLDFRRGEDLTEAGRFPDALPIFARLSADYPDCSHFRNYHGRCLLILNQHDAAERELLAALELDDQRSTTLFSLGRIADLRDDPERALDFYERTVAAYPMHLDALLRIRALHQRKKLLGEVFYDCIRIVDVGRRIEDCPADLVSTTLERIPRLLKTLGDNAEPWLTRARELATTSPAREQLEAALQRVP